MSVNCIFNVTNLSRKRYLQFLGKQRKAYEETGEWAPLDSFFWKENHEEMEMGVDGDELFIYTLDTLMCRENEWYLTILDNMFFIPGRLKPYFGDRYTSRDFDEYWSDELWADLSKTYFFLPVGDLDYSLREIEGDHLRLFNKSTPVEFYELEHNREFYFEAVRICNILRRLKNIKKRGLNVTITISN